MTLIELMDKVVPRLVGSPSCTLFEAVREVQAIISNRLLMARSEMLREELTIDFMLGDSSVELDQEFQSVSERPYVDGKSPLSPLNRVEKHTLQTPGSPRYYDIVGKTLWLYPPPDENMTVRIPAFIRPMTPTDLADTLPFFGDLDSVFVEGCVGLLSLGLGAVADPNFVALIQNQVDQLLMSRNMANEQALADSINYGR